jgi:hypothetical protein
MPESTAERDPVRVSRSLLLLVALALAALWAISFRLLHGRVLATWQGEEALAPLYAFVSPLARPGALLFAALGLGLTLFSGRLCDPERLSRVRFAVALLAAAVLLPLALFLVRSDLADLGRQFDLYRNEEFFHDARRIGSLPRFLEDYVAIMPTLSLHGQHFPPGHAILLHIAAELFGPSALVAGLVVLAFSAAAILLSWRVLEHLAGARAARQGSLLLLACPALLDFACTSMDAVFLFFATLAWLLSLRALASESRPPRAWLAGAALLLSTFFSFSALPVGLAILLHALFRGRGAPFATAARLMHMAAGYVGAAWLLFAATGFPIWSCLHRARESGLALIRRAAGVEPGSLWALFSLGNATSFLIGAGLALVAAAVARACARPLRGEPWTPAALLTLLAMSCGGIYFLETERVWLFALPWLAAVAVSAGPFSEGSQRLLLAAGLAQALLLETALFTLW